MRTFLTLVLGGLGPLLDPYPRWFRWLYRGLLTGGGAILICLGMVVASMPPTFQSEFFSDPRALGVGAVIALVGAYVAGQRRGSALALAAPAAMLTLLGLNFLVLLLTTDQTIPWWGFLTPSGMVLLGMVDWAITLRPYLCPIERWADR